MSTNYPKIDMHNLCEITSSKRIFASDYVSEGMPFYRGKEITEKFKGELEVSTELFISKAKFEEIRVKFGVPQPGDLLLTSVGTLGSPYVVQSGEEFYFKDGNLTWFRKFKGLDSRYLYFWLVSPQGKAELKKCTIGSSQSAFTIVLLKGMQIELPPLPVQRRIAAILSAYDDLIENNQRRIAILEELARSLYREWFVHFRFPGHENARFVEQDGVRAPEGWDVVRYTDLVDVLSGGTPKTSVSEYWDGDIPWFTPRDRPDSFFVLDTAKRITNLGLSKCNSKLYSQDTVFITARGTVGECAITAVPMAMNQTCYALRGRFLSSQYLVFLMTLELVEALKKNATGAVFDAIVVDTFRQRFIVKPPHELATQLAALLEPSFLMIKTLQLKQVNLRRTRDLLLPRLVSGELDVSELEIAGVEVTRGND